MKLHAIPSYKRRKIHTFVALVVALLTAVAAGLMWYIITQGAGDFMTILLASILTIAFGCSVMALVTGRMEWLLLGLWETGGL